MKRGTTVCVCVCVRARARACVCDLKSFNFRYAVNAFLRKSKKMDLLQVLRPMKNDCVFPVAEQSIPVTLDCTISYAM